MSQSAIPVLVNFGGCVIASLLSVYLTFNYLLPRLPGISIQRDSRLIALVVAVLQTSIAIIVGFVFGVTGIYSIVFIGLGGGVKAVPGVATFLGIVMMSIIFVSATFLVFFASLFSREKVNVSKSWVVPLAGGLITVVELVSIAVTLFLLNIACLKFGIYPAPGN